MEETQISSVKRGKSFTNNQDVAICNAWLSVTQDPTLDNNLQTTSNNFWDRVLEFYVKEANDESSRSRVSIQSRFGKIMRSCNKFRGYLSNLENMQQIEVSEAQKVHQAKLLYGQLEGKKFTFDHCWEILQYGVKWQDSVIQKKHASANDSPNPHSPSASPISLSSNHDPIEDDNHDDHDHDDDIAGPNAKRKRAENESRKKKKKSKVVVVDTSMMRFCELLFEFSKQACETEKRKALAQERKLTIMEEADQREKKKAEVELKIMVERNEREQREKDDQIMMMDISNMEPQTKAYFEHRKAEILAKLKPLSSL